MRRRWSSGAPRTDGVEVELVEWHDDGPMGSGPADGRLQGEPGEPGELGEPTAGSVGPGRSRGRRAVRWAAGLAVLLLLAVVVNVVEARRDAARAAAFEGIPGLVAPMPEPLTEVWRHPGGWLVGEADGVLLVSGLEGGLTALDPSTGEVRWAWAERSEPGTGWCRVEPLAERSWVTLSDVYASVPDAGSSVVLCSGVGAGTGVDEGPDASTAVTLIDPSTGSERFTVAAPGGQLAAQVVAGGLVVTTALPDGRVRVERWHVSTGEPSWALASAQPVLGVGGTGFERYQVVQDTLVLVGSGTVAVSLATGQEVDPASVPDVPYYVLETPLDGATATWEFEQDGSGSGRVTDADGTVRFDLPGPVWTTPPADGPAADVLLVVSPLSGGLQAIDLRSGGELWLRPQVMVVLVVDDLVVISDGTTLSAIRLTDGETVWEVATDPQFQVTGVTDGDVILAAVLEGGLSHLVALNLADGEEAWRSDAAFGGYPAAAVDGHVVVQTGSEIIGYG